MLIEADFDAIFLSWWAWVIMDLAEDKKFDCIIWKANFYNNNNL